MPMKVKCSSGKAPFHSNFGSLGGLEPLGRTAVITLLRDTTMAKEVLHMAISSSLSALLQGFVKKMEKGT